MRGPQPQRRDVEVHVLAGLKPPGPREGNVHSRDISGEDFDIGDCALFAPVAPDEAS